MARTLKNIEDNIIRLLKLNNVSLNDSKVAEWRVWTSVCAGVLHSFELMIDVFCRDIESHPNIVRMGTADWYALMVNRYQHNHELVVDKETYKINYATDDDEAKIIKQVAVTEFENYLLIKVAGADAMGKLIPLSFEELVSVKSYIDKIKFVGTHINLISQVADDIRYNIVVYCDDDENIEEISNRIKDKLSQFQATLSFNAKLYSNKLLSTIMEMKGVVTTQLVSLQRKSYLNTEYYDVGIVDTIDAGYFNYADDSILIVKRINELKNED